MVKNFTSEGQDPQIFVTKKSPSRLFERKCTEERVANMPSSGVIAYLKAFARNYRPADKGECKSELLSHMPGYCLS